MPSGYVGPGRWAYDETMMTVAEWLAMSEHQRNQRRAEAIERGRAEAQTRGIQIRMWNHIRVAAGITPATSKYVLLHCEATIPNS